MRKNIKSNRKLMKLLLSTISNVMYILLLENTMKHIVSFNLLLRPLELLLNLRKIVPCTLKIIIIIMYVS